MLKNVDIKTEKTPEGVVIHMKNAISQRQTVILER